MEWIGWALVIFALGGLGIWFIFRNAAANVDVDRMVAEAQAADQPAKSLEEPKNGMISLREDGFTLSRDQKVISEVQWSEVLEIRACKADLFSTDLICWAFVMDGDATLEVHEEMAGFKALEKAVEARFGVALEDWFQQVAFPAFEENMTVIWPKDSGHSRA